MKIYWECDIKIGKKQIFAISSFEMAKVRKEVKMEPNNSIKLFEDKNIRVAWNEDEENWYFSVVDVVGILTNSDYQKSRNYWKWLKNKLNQEVSWLVILTN